MEKAIAIFAMIQFIIIGCSHVLQRQAWREFFVLLHSQGRAGAFANGFLTLITGSLIVAFHNVWSGAPVILTLVGWAYLVKSAVIFVHPDWGLRSMAQVEHSSPAKFRIAGFGMLGIAGLLGVFLLTDVYESLA